MSFIPSDQPLRWLVGKQDMILRKQVSVSAKSIAPYRQCFGCGEVRLPGGRPRAPRTATSMLNTTACAAAAAPKKLSEP